jgi:hypothetical protein
MPSSKFKFFKSIIIKECGKVIDFEVEISRGLDLPLP